jgi:hypothetical protein
MNNRNEEAIVTFYRPDPSGFEESPPSQKEPSPVCAFESKVEQKPRLSLSSRVEPVKVSVRKSLTKWGQAEDENKKSRTGGDGRDTEKEVNRGTQNEWEVRIGLGKLIT